MEHSYLRGWKPIGGLEVGRQYAHAPIVQAILEFKVESPADLPLTTFERIAFGDEYLDSEPVFRLNAEIQVEAGLRTAVSHAQRESAGFTYARRDKERTIQASPSNFTFVWHGAYSTWEALIEEAEAAWIRYREVAQPVRVHSMGARFVNVISLPNKPVELKDYLRLSVDIPAALPQGVRNLFAQIDIPMDEFDAACIITTGIVDPTDEHPGGSMLLDIDVRSSVEIDTVEETFDGAIRSKLDTLRMAKNLVFEACITDATRGRIN